MPKEMFIKSVGFTYKERRLIEKIREKVTLNDISEKAGIKLSVLSHALRVYCCNSITKDKIMQYITEASTTTEINVNADCLDNIDKTNIRSDFNINSANMNTTDQNYSGTKPPKQNCECGEPSVCKSLCLKCYSKYWARKNRGCKPQRDFSLIFNAVLTEVKKGFTITKSCKNTNVSTACFYMNLNGFQKAELRACKRPRRWRRR